MKFWYDFIWPSLSSISHNVFVLKCDFWKFLKPHFWPCFVAISCLWNADFGQIICTLFFSALYAKFRQNFWHTVKKNQSIKFFLASPDVNSLDIYFDENLNIVQFYTFRGILFYGWLYVFFTKTSHCYFYITWHMFYIRK